MTVLEERLRSRGQVRLPFDSLAVVARHTAGGARAAVVAEAVADDLTAMLARSRSLRIPRAEFVRPYDESDLTPEEIGRELNVRGIALCTIATGEAHVDASLDLIDVTCDELVAHETFLVSNQELIALERVMLHTIAGMRTASHPVTADEGVYAAIVEARVMRARGDAEGALAILKGVAAPLEVAATIVEGRLTSRIGAAREALRGIRGSVPALQLLAKLLSRFDAEWLAAEEVLREALRIDPASPSTHGMLGDILLATHRREEAARHHRVAAELMPRDRRAQIAAVFEEYFGPQPIRAAPRFAKLGATDWQVRALIAGGDVVQARHAASTPFSRALLAAFTNAPFDPAPFGVYERALLFAAAGATEEAIACLEKADGDEGMFAGVEPLLAACVIPSRADGEESPGKCAGDSSLRSE